MDDETLDFTHSQQGEDAERRGDATLPGGVTPSAKGAAAKIMTP